MTTITPESWQVVAPLIDKVRRMPCTDEAAYLAAWKAHALPLADGPLPLAVAGGMIADRLAWVFQAGYQAACRDAFPEIRCSGWIAYAASEDRKGDPPLPGVTLADGHLHGSKTWVAAARSLDQMVIKLGSGPDARYLRVPRDAPGLTLVPGHRSGFLGDLSQGQAHFERTPLSATAQLDPGRIRRFPVTEPLYLYAAFCGFVIGSTREAELDRCARDCLAAVAAALGPAGSGLDRSRLAHADALAQDLRTRLAGNRLQAAGDWPGDERLIAMYSRSLQEQAQGH